MCSCSTTDENSSKIALVKDYYEALDNSDISKVSTLLTDSLVTKETEFDYEQTFTKAEYLRWMQWDSIFNPTYDIIALDTLDKNIKVKVSKIDSRIAFLHKEPIITSNVIQIENQKIITVETTNYDVFNDSTFVKNRDELVNWINEYHPELDGFLFDQTKEGGLKYLEAINLYTNRMKVSNKERCITYLKKYADKDINAMNSMFADDIILRDWKIYVEGKKEALRETQKNFEAAQSIAIDVLKTYENEDTVAAELKITVNKTEVLYVVDVITFNASGKITSIRAYLGRGNG